jgi:hypothetical protein
MTAKPTMTAKPNKTPTLEDYRTCEEFRARFDAEKTMLARHYCTLFGFWRSCTFKLCRRVHACGGDAHACLARSVARVPRRAQFDARQALMQAAPRQLAAPERAARAIMPDGFDDSSGALTAADIPPGWTRPAARRARDGRRSAKR